MKFGEVFVLLLTFATGVAAGSYIYFNGFRSIDIDPVNPRSINEYEILVTLYGGCQRAGSCSSYRVLANGEYIIVPGGFGEDANITRSGELTNSQQAEIAEVLANANLNAQAESIEPDYCKSWVDGIDTEYDITLEGERYVIDTCDTAIDIDSDLIELLDDLMVDLVSQ